MARRQGKTLNASLATSAELASVLERVRGFVIDMDGVLYRGETVLPHVNDFLDVLDSRGTPYVLATNNSTRLPEQYVQKLAAMGIVVTSDRIQTSGQATAAWVKQRYARGTTVYVLGMTALEAAVYGDGYFVQAGKDAEVVVCGADFEVTYEKLRIATLAIRRGAAFVATNGDTTFPTEEGLIPGAGSILAALVAATSVEPEVIGKPSTGMLMQGAQLLGTDPESTVMLGDRLDTDILAGRRAGFVTIMVLTGVTTLAEVRASDLQPDVLLPDLEPLVEFYRSHT
jgi:4-nitrophenyl phosphatase